MKKIFALVVAAGTAAMAAPITVDLTDATTTLTNVGTAIVGLSVLGLGFVIAVRFIRRGV